MNQILKKQLFFGVIWSFIGRFGYFFITLIANIILARLIGPKAFGQIGIIMFFITIAKMLTESGLTGALVRKTEIKEEDYSTVFIFNLAISIFLFLLFLLLSGFLSSFYNDEILKNLLIAASFVLIINAFQIANNAKLIRTLNYKRKSIIEFIAISLATIISISLAVFFNFGVWAVVALHLLTALFITIQLWFHFGSLKTLKFSNKSFKNLYKFGINTTLASLLNTGFDNIYQLVFAKFFAIQQSGFFYQAKKLQEAPVGILNSVTQGIVFAALSRIQNEKEQFSKTYKKVFTLFTVFIGFVCLIIYFYANEIILLLYGQQWLESVFYLQILIISAFFYMQEMFNRIIFKVFDRTEKILILEIVKKIFQSFTIGVGIFLLRIDILLYGFLLTSVVSYFINYYYSRKVFGGFSWFEIIMVQKVLLIIFLSLITGSILKDLLQLRDMQPLIMFPFFIAFYILLIKILKISNIIYDLFALKKMLLMKSSD